MSTKNWWTLCTLLNNRQNRWNGRTLTFILVCLGVIVLRMRQPDLPRPFKNPFGITLPVLGIISCGALMAFLPAITWYRFLLWMAVGLVLYFAYSYRHSHLNAAQ